MTDPECTVNGGAWVDKQACFEGSRGGGRGADGILKLWNL